MPSRPPLILEGPPSSAHDDEDKTAGVQEQNLLLQTLSPVVTANKKAMLAANSDHDAAATADLTVDDEEDESIPEGEDEDAAVILAEETSLPACRGDVAVACSPCSPNRKKQQRKEGFPGMYWLNMPEKWTIKEDEEGDKHLKINCPEEVDYWRHTLHGFVKDDGPFYWKFVYGDFEARLTVKGKFHYLYDMAGLMVRQNEDHWMTCGVSNFQDNLQSRYHKHQNKHLYVSTTFTRGKSDWSTHRAMQKKPHKSSVFHVWVRRLGNVLECYYSLDNELWIKVREGVLAPGVRKLKVGMVCTAPESAGFSVAFSNFMVRGGDKMPEDDIEHLVYKTNGSAFVGMLEEREVDRRTELAKQRMLKRVAKERSQAKKKNHDSPSKKTVPKRKNPPSNTRSFHEEDSPNDYVVEHHTRKKTDAVAPTRQPVFALPVKSKKSTAPTQHIIQATNPAREVPKERPTNPYAVAQPPPEKEPRPTKEEDEESASDDEPPPPPKKAPMTNPYAVAPPKRPPRQESLPARAAPPIEKTPARNHSAVATNSAPRQNERPRNELSGKSLRRATVNEQNGQLSKLSNHLGNPMGKESKIGRRKSDDGRRPPPYQRVHPARSKSDVGPPQRRRPPPPPPPDNEKEMSSRRKSWWSLGIPKRKKYQEETKPKRQLSLKNMLQRQRDRSNSGNPPQRSRRGPEPRRKEPDQAISSGVEHRTKRPSTRSKPTMPQRRPSESDESDVVSFNEEDFPLEDDPEDSPPKQPERQPSVEDDTVLLLSDDDEPVKELNGSNTERKLKKKKKRSKKSDASDPANQLGVAKKKRKKKKSKSNKDENGMSPKGSKKEKKKNRKEKKSREVIGE